MDAGQELDALVATEVMGWRRTITGTLCDSWVDARGWPTGWGDYDGERVFEPSTDIAAAWQVVERLNTLGYDVQVDSYEHGTMWSAILYKGLRGEGEQIEGPTTFTTAPHAICLAALKAVGVEA